MRDPRDYLDEIQQNLKKIQSQPNVTPAESALFGMIDGLAGLQRITMERVAALELALQGRTAEAARRRHDVIEATRGGTDDDHAAPDPRPTRHRPAAPQPKQ